MCVVRLLMCIVPVRLGTLGELLLPHLRSLLLLSFEVVTTCGSMLPVVHSPKHMLVYSPVDDAL